MGDRERETEAGLPDNAVQEVQVVKGGNSWFQLPELSNPTLTPLVFPMKKHIEVPKFGKGLFVVGTAGNTIFTSNVIWILDSRVGHQQNQM